MSSHDPIRQSKYLRQTLSQDKKPIGFFISTGCPLAVKMPEGSWPLIPDVAGLTRYVSDELGKLTTCSVDRKRSPSDCYIALIEELGKAAGQTHLKKLQVIH
jgi:hypothetical protein